METKVKYITDQDGHRKSVIVPINDWNVLQLDIKEAKEFNDLKKSLEIGFYEVAKIISNKLPKKSLDEFLQEN